MKPFFTFLLVFSASLIASRAAAQVEIFMKLTDRNGNMINGDSQVPNYVGWSELLSTGSNIRIPINISSNSGGTGAGRASVDTFPIQMLLNSVSIPLAQSLVTGSAFNAVDIWFRKASGATTGCSCAYYKIHLEIVAVNNIINGVDTSGNTQQINFVPRRIAWAYYKPNANGTVPATPTNNYGWDFTLNALFVYNF